MAHLMLTRKGEEAKKAHQESIRKPEPAAIDGVFLTRDNVAARGPLPGKVYIPHEVLDSITRDHSAFGSFAELLNAAGNYRPTIDVSNAARLILADAYDSVMAHRGDSRRAFRREVA